MRKKLKWNIRPDNPFKKIKKMRKKLKWNIRLNNPFKKLKK